MNRRILVPLSVAVLLAASADASLAAAKKTTTKKKTPVTSAPTTQASAATPAPTSGPCDKSKPEIKVGVSYSLSGPLATLGQDFLAGTEIAADDANTVKGGILGRCVKLIVKDDEASATKGAQVVRQLVSEEKVAFLVGPFSSSVLGGTLDFTTKEKVLSANATAFPNAGDATKYPYAYRLSSASDVTGKDFASYAVKKKWGKVGVLAVNATLGTSTLDAFKKALPANIEVTTQMFETGTVDITPALSKLQDSLPDALYFFSTAGDLANSLKARATLKYFAPTLSYSTVADEASVAAAGGSANMRGVIAQGFISGFLRPVNGSGPRSQAYAKFLAKLRVKKGETKLKGSGNIPAAGYAGLDMFLVAANKVGSVDADAVKKYLDTNGYDGVAPYTFTATNHDALQPGSQDFAFATTFFDGTLEVAP